MLGAAQWGSQRVREKPRKDGVHPTLGTGLLTGSGLSTSWGRELTRHRMSFLIAGQCVHGCRHQGGRTNGLNATISCCCWEGDNHWFGSLTVVAGKREKASLQGTGGLSLEECAGVTAGSYLSGFVGWHLAHEYHPAVSKIPFFCSPLVLRMLSRICSPGAGRYLGTDCPLTHPHRWQSGPWRVPWETACT